MYHVTLAIQCIYGRRYIGENEDEKEGSEIPGRGERVEVTCSLVCR